MLGKGVSVLKTETPLICGVFGRQKMGEVGQDLKKKKHVVLSVSVFICSHYLVLYAKSVFRNGQNTRF